MTISSTNRKAGPYAGNDVSVAFPFAFKVFSNTDVVVYFTSTDGVETQLALGTNYSISLNSDQEANPGGTVTLPAALATGTKLTLTSDVAELQPVTLTNNGGFYPRVINDALDRATIQIQQLREKLSRALVWPISSSTGSLPDPVGNTVIGWNSAGTALVNIVLSAGSSMVDLAKPAGASLIGFIQSGTGAVTRTSQDKMRETVSVLDFGVNTVPGTTDMTAAINAAIAYLTALGGGTLYFPRGVYKVTSTIKWNANNITLAGDGGAVDGNVTYVGGMTAAINALASRIVWGGSAGGTVVQIAPSPDNGTQAAVVGGGMLNIAVDGNSTAADGIDLRSLRYARFENVSSMRCTSINWKIGTTSSNVTGGNKSIAFCSFKNCTGSNATLGGSAKTMVLYGHITDGNVAINTFDNCGFYSGTGVGSHIEVECSDSNTFIHCRWNGSLTLHATDTGSFSTGDAVARHNIFYNIQGHVVAKAKIATPHTQGTNGFDSYGNVCFGYSRENGISYPTVEAYADFQYHQTGLGLVNREGGTSFGKAPNITLMAKTVNQSIPTGASTVVDWDSVSYDWLSCGDASTNRVTAPNGCKWVRFIYGVEWANDSTAGRFVGIGLNGTANIITKNQETGYINSQDVICSQWFAVTPGDYYQMIVSQNTAGALNLIGTTSTFLQAEWC